MGALRKFVKEETKKQSKKGHNSGNQNNNFDNNINMISGCDNSDDDESSQEINCNTSNTPSQKAINNNTGIASNPLNNNILLNQ